MWYVWQKLEELEKCLLNLDSGDESAVRAVIEEFSTDVQPDEDSVLNKYWCLMKIELVTRINYLFYVRQKKKLTLLSRSFFDRLSTINKCFSAETVEDIIKAFVRVQHSQLLILLLDAVKSPSVSQTIVDNWCVLQYAMS